MQKNFKSILTMSTPNVLDQSHWIIFQPTNDARNPMPNRTTRPCLYVILYVHVCNIKLYFYLKVGILGLVGPVKQLIKLKWPYQPISFFDVCLHWVINIYIDSKTGKTPVSWHPWLSCSLYPIYGVLVHNIDDKRLINF